MVLAVPGYLLKRSVVRTATGDAFCRRLEVRSIMCPHLHYLPQRLRLRERAAKLDELGA